jgi:site-specific recombinase XerC
MPTTPLFLGADGERIHPRYPALPNFARLQNEGINGERASGALVHGLRHTFATELANVSV